MKWTISLLILIGLIAALCAALLTASLRAGAAERRAKKGVAGDVTILVATRPMVAMSVVDASAIAQKTVAGDSVPETAHLNATDVIGQVLISPMVDGQMYTTEHFATEESGLHLASTLPEGRRAMSVYLTTDSGIEELLYPGCLVDVIGSFRLPANHGRPSGEIVSATLLQGVQVLAIGPRTIVSRSEEDQSALAPAGVDRKQKRMVTLMVNPDQAEALQLASAYGELALAMRNPLDTESSPDRGVLLSELSGDIADRLASFISAGDAATPMFAAVADSEGDGAGETEQVTSVRGNQYWTTIVLRGRQPQRLTFPMQESMQEQMPKSPVDGQ